MKQTNEAVRPVAEPVEPRTRTKGNAEQQSTLRTQGRERVTQALGRVRLAARQRKKEQFTAVLHHINVLRPQRIGRDYSCSGRERGTTGMFARTRMSSAWRLTPTFRRTELNWVRR